MAVAAGAADADSSNVTQPTPATDNVPIPSVGAASLAASATLGTSTLRVPKFMPSVLQQVKRVEHYLLVPTGTIPPAVIPQSEDLGDPAGLVGTYQPGGQTVTSSNAFFQSLGSNGRTCFSCHQPGSGMSISVDSLRGLFYSPNGDQDPVFAPVDGADCPNNAHNHNLLLNKGLFRIFLPVPDNAEYTLKVYFDPNGCNTDPTYATSVDPTTGQTKQMVSVYRRPRMSSNLKFVTHTAAPSQVPPFDIITGAQLPVDQTAGDVENGLVESGNIMWDGREPTLESQANDATLGHAQAKVAPTSAQIAQIVQFENGVFNAQDYDNSAGSLNANGATGGVVNLSNQAPIQIATSVFNEDSAWASSSNSSRLSVSRGMQIFNNRTFNISNVTGINNSPIFGKSQPATCGFCHSQVHAGNSRFPVAQVDMGIGGDQPNFGGPQVTFQLPVFKLTCNGGTPFNGNVVTTNDPGMALITGKCADIGRRTPPLLRGVVSHRPFFSDGSAGSLAAVIDFYNNRFSIGLSAQDKTDLANFLQTL